MQGFISIKGEIGLETTLADVESQIKGYPSATAWTVNINSPGGNVYEGIDIFHAIKKLSNVTVVVETMAASIATLIMQAGDKVIALRPSSIMIHNPMGEASGDANDFRAAAEQLDHVKSLIASAYKKRAKVKSEDLHQMMDKETWMTADEAAAMGFIDEVQEKIKAVAKFNKSKMDTATKEDVKKEVDGLWAKFQNFFKEKIKNIAMTLEDGTAVMIDTEDPADLAQKKITKEDGSPVPDGEHILGDGRTIVVAGGIITEVKEKLIEEDMKKEEAEALKAENEALKAELAKAQGAAAKAADEVAATNKAMVEFKNKFEKELSEIKNKAFGDNYVPGYRPGSDQEENTVLHPTFMKFHNHANDIWIDKRLVNK